jgi:hypothetical protein
MAIMGTITDVNIGSYFIVMAECLGQRADLLPHKWGIRGSWKLNMVLCPEF